MSKDFEQKLKFLTAEESEHIIHLLNALHCICQQYIGTYVLAEQHLKWFEFSTTITEGMK